MKPTKNALHYTISKIKDLSNKDIEILIQLMFDNYDCVSKEDFLSDLYDKEYICLLKDSSEKIQGFSTVAINPKNCGSDSYNIIYSGDTIISPNYWGSQSLVKGFCYLLGQLIATEKNKKWYWLLLSKGHRTYMYLPLFTKKFYPTFDSEREEDLASIINDCATILFGKYWNADTGLVSFSESRGQLKTIHNEATNEKANHPQIAYFLKKNPRYENGDELLCMTDLDINNLRRMAKRFLSEGLNSETKIH